MMKRTPKTPALAKLAMLLLFAIAAVAILDTTSISAQELGRTITSPFGIARQTSASESGSDGDTFVDPETGEVGHIIRNPFGVANPEGVDTGIDIPDDAGEEVGGIITSPFGVPASDDIDTGVDVFDEDEEYLISLPDDEESEVEESEDADEVDDETSDEVKVFEEESAETTTEKYVPVIDNPIPNREWDDFYIEGRCGSNNVRSSTDNPGERETLFVQSGQKFSITVFSHDIVFSQNNPTWTITADNNNPTGQGESGLQIQDESTHREKIYKAVPRFKYGRYLITVSTSLNECVVSRKIKIIVFTFEIGKAIRRGNPDSDWTNNRVSLYTPDSCYLNLSLEKRESQFKGDCAFLLYDDNNESRIERNINITTVRGLNRYYIKGITESDNENDIILKIKKMNGDTIIERSFIVYSQFVDEYFERHLPDFLQHKDTDEQCVLCPIDALNPLFYYGEGHCALGTHPNNPYCSHCKEYCVRACLKEMKRSNQDDYKRIRQIFYDPISNQPNVEFTAMYENHNSGLSAIEASYYLYGIYNLDGYTPVYNYLFNEKYNIILKYLFYNGAKKFIGACAIGFELGTPIYNHAFIIYGCYRNTKEGEITPPRIQIWDPWTGSTSEECEYEDESFFDSYGLSYLFFANSLISNVNI